MGKSTVSRPQAVFQGAAGGVGSVIRYFVKRTGIDMQLIRKYGLYLLRWQLSTPILTLVLLWLSDLNTLAATVIANLIGGLIFFWVDRFIFKSASKSPLWEIRDEVACADCGAVGRGYRVVEWFGYNRLADKTPEFRCERCKDRKLEEVGRKIGKKAV